MITRIELTNFMSHKHTVIEPARGLTVLVGPNNIGKSAVVAALQILCYNDNSTYVLRHGERECSVTVTTDDGHTIQWRRKNSPSYVIDGQAFDRLRGSGLPEELHRVLRLPKVDTGDQGQIDIHFGSQKSPIFLLGNSAANAARFFASSSDAIRLVQIQKRHKEKLSEAQREKNRLEAESRRLNAELEWLEPSVEIDRQLALLEQLYADVTQSEGWLDEARQHELALRQQFDVLARHQAAAKTLAALLPPPQLAAVEPLDDMIRSLSTVRRKRLQGELETDALRPLSPPPQLAATDGLEELIAKTKQAAHRQTYASACVTATSQLSMPPDIVATEPLDRLVARLQARDQELKAARQRCEAMRILQSPPELKDESALQVLLDQLAIESRRLDRWQHSLTTVANTAEPPQASDPAPLDSAIAALKKATDEFLDCQEHLSETEAALETAGADLRARSVDTLCPVCGNTLDAERVIARAIAGQWGHEHG